MEPQEAFRLDPATGQAWIGEGELGGWGLEPLAPAPQRERSVDNALLAWVHMRRTINRPDLAARVLGHEYGGRRVVDMICDALQASAARSEPEPRPAESPQEPLYPLTPDQVREEIDRKSEALRARPARWEMRARQGSLARVAWRWSPREWRAVEVSPEGRSRWLPELPSFVPVQREGETGRQHEKYMPGEEWLLRFDSADPVVGKTRASKNLKACELCFQPIKPGEEWVASSKTSSKRSHRSCFEKRRQALLDRRNV